MATEISREALCGLDVVAIAKSLIGAEIHTFIGGLHTAGRIVETEAYRGTDDKAAHSYGHRRTPRTEVFFGPGGHAYVYLIYGIHHMFNIVTGPVEQPDAVLIRAIEPLVNFDLMRSRRGLTASGPRIGNGPALVCQSLGIDRSHYGVDLMSEDSDVRLRGELGSVSARSIVASPRVGIAYAEECAVWPWRFRESGSPHTSPAK